LESSFQTHFFYEIVTLLAVLDPTAAIPIFLTATASLSRRQSLKVAAYAAGTAFLVLFFFIYAGQHLLQALKIPMTSFQLAGSIVLLLFGVKLVLGQVAEEVSAIPSNATLAQRAVYPLAIPTIAGAGSMLTVVLLTDNNVRTIGEQAITTSRLAISLAIVFGVLALSKWIFSVVGRPGIEVMSRVSGLILASIAVHNMIIAAKLSFGLP
jgi:multiple antibiotic resistance protein